MRVHFHLALIAMLLASCGSKSEYPGYTRTDDDLHYKLAALGEESRPVSGSTHISFSAKFKNLDDSLLAVKQFSQIRFESLEKSSILHKALMMCHEGDSILFIADAGNWAFGSLNMDIDFPDPIPVLAEIRVEKVFAGTEWQAWKREQARLRDLELKEQVNLQKVLDSLGIQRENHQDNTYIKILRQGRGKTPSFGDNVVADYRAMFSDGREFDNTYKGSSLEFMMGKPDQVLPGFATGISKMKEGGKAVFVVPSIVGFGEKGSSSGIVPPFTTLIYEVELKEVRKS